MGLLEKKGWNCQKNETAINFDGVGPNPVSRKGRAVGVAIDGSVRGYNVLRVVNLVPIKSVFLLEVNLNWFNLKAAYRSNFP